MPCGSSVSRPTRRWNSPPRSSWHPPARSFRKLPWLTPGPWRLAKRATPLSRRIDRCRNGSRNRSRPRKRAWPTPASWVKSAVTRMPHGNLSTWSTTRPHAILSKRPARLSTLSWPNRDGRSSTPESRAKPTRSSRDCSRTFPRARLPPMLASTWPSRPTWHATTPRWSGCSTLWQPPRSRFRLQRAEVPTRAQAWGLQSR